MGAKTKSDISNSAIRMFLQATGAFYDQARGYKRFNTSSTEWRDVLKHFENVCCYCGAKLTNDNATMDHLVPINKKSLGLHAWGNVVPCCRHCNKEKHHSDWETFIKHKNTSPAHKRRRLLIKAFQNKYRYNPNLNLTLIANNLYQDVGEVASTLVTLRLKQAEAVISALTPKKNG